MGITIGYESYYKKTDRFPKSNLVFSDNIADIVNNNISKLETYNTFHDQYVEKMLTSARMIARKIFDRHNIGIEITSSKTETFYGDYIKINGVNQWMAYGWNNYFNYEWDNDQSIKTQNAKPFYKIHVCIVEVLTEWMRHDLIDTINDETGYYPGNNVENLIRHKTGCIDRKSYIDNICDDHQYLKRHTKEFEQFYDVFRNQHPIITVDDFSVFFLDCARLNDQDKQNSYILQSKDLNFLNTIYYASENPLFNHLI